jgi:DNA invertase Pin-like site-specific DNA recombinase
MNTSSAKLQADHLERQAVVFIRQSTMHQVHYNQESQRRQYALQERAVALGWSGAGVVVIDEDQGRSGADGQRPGFQRLLRTVAQGEVGAIFSLEASRLSRQNSAWAALIELCAVQQVLLIDEDGIYDPNLPDDRLLLGIRGLLGETELETLRHRMVLSREEKARRCALRLHPPTGLVTDPHQGLRLDPDEAVQSAVRLLFTQFQRLSSATAVVRYFREHHLLFPTRTCGGPRDGKLIWQPLTYQRTLQVLHNPLYAGTYAYGRYAYSARRKPRAQCQQRRVRLSSSEWIVVQWDAFPGYISQAEYEANQQRLAANRPQPERAGSARMGIALLNRLVLCGRCGHPMHVAYTGSGGRYPIYLCRPHRQQGDNTTCQRISALPIDQSVAQVVLSALTPAAIELSLQVVDDAAQQQAALQQHWQHRLERATYEANLAQRRYQQVEPENRLVARTLEREWESALQTVAGVKEAYHQAQQAAPLALTAEDRAALFSLAQDLPALWAAESTTIAERKELLRLLLADVTLTRQEHDVLVQLRWVTNEVQTWTVPLPQRGLHTSQEIITRIRELAPTHTDADIAVILNADGCRTAHGQTFTASRVSSLRRTHRIVKVQRNARPNMCSKVQ